MVEAGIGSASGDSYAHMAVRFTWLAAWAWLGCSPVWAGGWSLSAEIAWHDNVTNAEIASDELSALLWQAEGKATVWQRRWSGHHVALFAGARSEVWPRFEGLDLFAPGLAAEWEWKPGFGPRWPVWQAGVEIERAFAREAARGGLGGAGWVAVRQRLGSAGVLLAGHEWRRFDAAAAAFDRGGRRWFGRADWLVSDSWHLALEASAREGDVVSYSRPPRPDLVASGKPVTTVDTFEQTEPWIAYYFRADTRMLAGEVGRVFGRGLSLTLRHEYRQTRHNGQGYNNRITSLSVVISGTTRKK